MKYYYERNTEFMESSLNKTFEEILTMTTAEFRQWVIDMRKLVVKLWDEQGTPPRVGCSEVEMAQQFEEMNYVNTSEYLVTDERTGEKDVIRIGLHTGNAVNQFFPTMFKTRINYSKDVDSGRSIYDFFINDDLLDRFITYATRHFKRDSFYAYSVPARPDDVAQYNTYPVAQIGRASCRERV